MALSQPELASTPPSGRHATPYTLQPCPRNTLRGAPPPRLSTCQRLTALSEPALASRVPSSLPLSRRRLSGVKAKPYTAARWPCSTPPALPSFPSPTPTLPSQLPP